jgi:cell division septation protein DedD
VRAGSRAIAVCALVGTLTPFRAAAQQGSLQVTAAAQSVRGDPGRTLGQASFEPDFGVSWLQPKTRLGLLEMELRGTRRGDRPHLGRAFFAARELKYRGGSWSIEAGDAYFSPAIGDYRFANLSTPSVTFAGASIAGRTSRATADLIVGRATAMRNLLGSDADTVDQTLALARASYKATDRLDLFTRASRVRTGDLASYDAPIAASDQGGVALRWLVTPAVHFIGDGSIVSYRRRGGDARAADGSGLAGASILLARGWIQVNAARFSAGELPVLNQPLNDRRTLFAAGELDAFARLRVFGGWEAYESNMDPHSAASPMRSGAANSGTRGFGGLRTPLGARSSLAVRVEKGDRRSRIIGASEATLSDTGVLTAEWQTNLGAVSGLTRYSRRENVVSQNLAGSHTVADTSGHLFVTLNQTSQFFGNASATRTTARDGNGSTFWQLGLGGQTQLHQRSLWLRAEGTVSRNVDLLSTLTVPQQSLSVGLNGEIARNVILGLNINADRVASPTLSEASWVSRSSVRVTRSFQTGSARTPASGSAALAKHGGTGSISGTVFSDWNANGRQDPGEALLENIPIRLSNLGNAATASAGDFAFTNVPIGLQQVGVDLSALPVDFDPPPVAQVQVQLGRGETKRVAFGLIPLTSLSGAVVLDSNGNGAADPGEPPVEGAVVVLDDGARSEQVRQGRFRFDAVRSGDHTLALVVDSLPDGMASAGPGEVPLSLTRARPNAEVLFLVTRQERPELRRAFAPRPSSAPAARPRSRRPAEPGRSAVPANSVPQALIPRAHNASAATPSHRGGSGEFAIQVIALNDPSRARETMEALKSAGFPAYIVDPPPADPDAPYRVRVGRYAGRAEAQAAAAALQKVRREKLWVVREP